MIRKTAYALALAASAGPFSIAFAAEADDEAERGEDIVATARAQKLYRVDDTATGKLPTKPLASSKSITVITKERRGRSAAGRLATGSFPTLGSRTRTFGPAGTRVTEFSFASSNVIDCLGSPNIGLPALQI